MALIDDINTAITESMKAKDQTRLSTLRMLKTALVNKNVERGHELDATESLQVVATLIKQRRESIDQFTKAGRTDLANKEAIELPILEAYLPPPLDQAELERVVVDAVQEAGASSPKDMGRVMKLVMAKLGGRGVDGKVVSELVRSKLAG